MTAQDRVDAVVGSTLLAKRGLREQLDGQPQLDAVCRALGRGAVGDATQVAAARRLMQIAYTSATKNHALLRCSAASIVGAVVEAAQLGLSVDGVLGHSYLVPYKVRGKDVATLQIGYRGFIHMAYSSGLVERLAADVVYEGDLFDYQEGTEAFLHHRRPLDAPEDGVVLGAFALCQLKGTRTPIFRVMPLRQILRHRERSQSWKRKKQDSPWGTDFEAMAMKTAVRALAKLIPSSDMQRASAADEQRDQGMRVSLVEAPAAGALPEGEIDGQANSLQDD